MTVRKASPGDLPALVALIRVMHDESPHYKALGYVEEKVIGALTRSMGDGPCFVHVDAAGAIDGLFVAIVAERWFSHDRFVTDLAVFVPPEKRGGLIAYRLFEAFIAWCESAGMPPADVQIGITTGVRQERTGAFYQRMGFERVGEVFRLGRY